jgi:hypothetical protein
MARSEKISRPDKTNTGEVCQLPPSQRRDTSQRTDAGAGQAQAATKLGRKFVVDVERQKCEVSDLTVDEARAMAADMTARLEALRQRWEASGDPLALLGALIFFALHLPEWLFKGLMQNFEQQFKNPDAIRFLAVRHAHDVLGKTMDESYDWACENIDDPIARGGRDTMMKSYQKIRSLVGQVDRIQSRPHRSRRGQ